MSDPVPLGAAWRAANPLPVHGDGTTKNNRGSVLAIGGSAQVPGGLRLTGEAALRVGAGKLQMATVASAALMLGMMVPEAAVIALSEDDEGDLAVDPAGPIAKALDCADAVVVGPGMNGKDAASRLVRLVAEAPREGATLVLDAAAVACAAPLCALLGGYAGRLVLTPHEGEMAGLMECDVAEVSADRIGMAIRGARQFGAVVVLKASETVVASPEGDLLHFTGGDVGLATGGSGDVLAGIIAGLISRGASPLVAAGWGVWLHGEAGRGCADDIGPIGFLARELLPRIPNLLPR